MGKKTKVKAKEIYEPRQNTQYRFQLKYNRVVMMLTLRPLKPKLASMTQPMAPSQSDKLSFWQLPPLTGRVMTLTKNIFATALAQRSTLGVELKSIKDLTSEFGARANIVASVQLLH